MEAAVAEKEAGMAEWNDGRLDDLSERVGRIETKMDAGFERVHKEIQGLNGQFYALQRTIVQMGAVVIAALIGLIATMIGLIVTQI
ncbi:MAG TPA: hypothetical protein VFS64_09215 [Solirubrobacterales bacterium]|nr:hypothetical protein [Solirubrobacterales bacterium]